MRKKFYPVQRTFGQNHRKIWSLVLESNCRLLLVIVIYFTLIYLLKFSDYTQTRLSHAHKYKAHALLLSFTKKPLVR